MRAYTKVGIWPAGRREKQPNVPYPIEVQIGERGPDLFSIDQASALIQQLERTISEVQRRRAKAGK